MTPAQRESASRLADLPAWAAELAGLYASNATNQFLLYGNVHDRLLLPLDQGPALGSLSDFLQRVLMPRFDVVLSYDLGNGIRVEQGEHAFSQWPYCRENPELPKAPRNAVETLTRYFRYCANLAHLNQQRVQVGLIVQAAHLVAPALDGGFSYDLGALALLIREWATSTLLTEHTLATFLITENLNDLHPLLVHNTRAARLMIPLPSPEDLHRAFRLLAPGFPTALRDYLDDLGTPAHQLVGATLGAIESLLKTKEYDRQPLAPADLVRLKRQLVENDCNGLIEFIESERTLDDLDGQDAIKAWLRQDIALWRRNDLQAMPMGYLFCGPVGTGKTFMVECLAGEAGVPVVKLKNFRDKWIGSTESNLEKIFRLLHALGRCVVFIDEADQALGKREAGSGDSGLSGRVYSMLAEEMGNRRNRGRIVWILASSRPDLIEVDLKRPGRIDVKIPIFPATTAREGFQLIRVLCGKRGVEIPPSEFERLEPLIPPLLTAGAAEALAVRLYRLVRTASQQPVEALRTLLTDYQNPVPPAVMDFQLDLAISEASDLTFVPPLLRARRA